MKKIVAISMVKNEMDVIESFVRHTLSFADELWVADHRSTDRTREILESLQKEGLPLEVETVRDAAHVQAEVLTRLLWRAADAGADVILPLDADEFLVPVKGTSCRAILETVAGDTFFCLHWRRHVPENWQEGQFLLAQPLLREPSWDRAQKVLLLGAFVRQWRPKLMQGNHGVILQGEGYGAPFFTDVEIAHFPWRSAAQAGSKYAMLWLGGAAKYTRDTLTSSERNFARLCKGGTIPSPAAGEAWPLSDLRGKVAPQTLRYSAGTTPNLLSNVLRAAENFANEVAVAKVLAKPPLVTTVVPFCGEAAPFLSSFASALAEEYPAQEIFLLELAADFPADEVRETLAEHQASAAGKDIFLLREKVFAELAARARGAFVELLLPGERVRSGKLRQMAASLALHQADYPGIDMLLASAPEEGTDEAALAFSETYANTVARMPVLCRREIGKNGLLLAGKCPAQGLAGALFRRELLAEDWLAAGFSGGQAHPLLLWWGLFTQGDSVEQGCGLVPETFAMAAPPTLDELAVRQLDWHGLLAREISLTPEEQAAALDAERRAGIALLERAMAAGVDFSRPLWREVQAMLARL